MPPKGPAEQLKALLASAEFPRSVCIVSSSAIRRDRALATILAHLLATTKINQEAVERYNCQDFSKDDLRALRQNSASLSLFSSETIIVLNHVEELNAATAKEVAAVISASSTGVYFITLASSLNKTNPFNKLHSSKKTLIELEDLKGYELSRWVEKELKNNSVTYSDPKIVTALIEIGHESPDQIYPLIERLALYADGETVTKAHIALLFKHDTETNEFEFIDTITSGNIGKAETMVGDIVGSGKSPFGLVALIFRSFSQLLVVKSMKTAGLAPGEIRQRLALSPWLSQKYLTAIESFTLAELRAAIKSIARADSLLKNKSLGAEAILSQLIHDLA